MKKQLLTLAAASILIWSCSSDTKKAPANGATGHPAETTLSDAHSAKNSLDWAGTYTGVTPCADCEGIQTEITIGKDLRFVIKSNYMGKDTKFPEERGTFSWDSTGTKVEFLGVKDQPATYFVGENTLTQLDMEGKKITGPLADKFILKKQTIPTDK